MQDIVFYEAFQEEADALRARLPSSVSALFRLGTIQETRDKEPPARIVSIRTQSVLPDSWADGLGAVLTRSTGFDHLLAYHARTGCACPSGYLPLYCNRAVAEQAMLLWTALLRKLPLQRRQFTGFHRDGLTGRECEHRTLVVVGVGNIGSQIVRIGMGLGMNVFGVDLARRWDWVEYVDIDEALPWADVVVCAMNLTAENRGFFDRDRLGQFKKCAIFVNSARGELADAVALLDLLEAGHLGGVGLDVYEDEPELAVALRGGTESASAAAVAVQKLTRRSDAICTPHNAFNTEEAVARKAEQSIEQLRTFLETGQFRWPVRGGD